MSQKITFGWRVADFPEYGADSAAFRTHIFNFMDVLHAGGLDSAWVGDHFLPWAGALDQRLDTIEAWTTITYLMARYPRMRYGTIVLSQSYRSPAALAKMAAMAQWLSGGRFVLGIGAGWKENEYNAYGYDFPVVRDRMDQLEEAVQIIRAMWREESPTFQGKHYRIDGAYCNPRPDPIPPLMVGGVGPRRTLRIVAKYADWCNLNNATLEAGRASLDILREHCCEVGRDYAEIVKTYSSDCVALASTHGQAEQIARASFFNAPTALVGTPDEVTTQLRRLVDLGISHFILRFADFPSTAGAELFMREVMPRFS